MNQNIIDLENTLGLLWTARLEAYNAHNMIGHDFICRAQRRIEERLMALINQE